MRVELRRLEGQHRGVPAHFRALCYEASRGSRAGYSHIGYHLASLLTGEIPYDLDSEKWLDELLHLTRMLEADEEKNVWKWFHKHLPKFMELIPSRRKAQFLSGVWMAYEEGLIGE